MRRYISFLIILAVGFLSGAYAEEDSITKAYKREYTYLVNQKKILESELKNWKTNLNRYQTETTSKSWSLKTGYLL